MQIFISRHGKRYGPYSPEELREPLRSGMFEADDSASVDGGYGWVPLHTLSAIALPPFTVRVEEQGNLLVICYRGEVGADEVARCREKVVAALPRLNPGFQLLVDLTDLTMMAPEAAAEIKQIMNQCNTAGVSTVVRVLPDLKRDIGLQIMSYFHYRPGVRFVTCASREEATKALAESRPSS